RSIATPRPTANTAAIGYRNTPPCLKKLTTSSTEFMKRAPFLADGSSIGRRQGSGRWCSSDLHATGRTLRGQAAVIRDLPPEFVTIHGCEQLLDQAAHRPVRPRRWLRGLPGHDAHDLRQLAVAGDRRGVEFQPIRGTIVRGHRGRLRGGGWRC